MDYKIGDKVKIKSKEELSKVSESWLKIEDKVIELKRAYISDGNVQLNEFVYYINDFVSLLITDKVIDYKVDKAVGKVVNYIGKVQISYYSNPTYKFDFSKKEFEERYCIDNDNNIYLRKRGSDKQELNTSFKDNPYLENEYMDSFNHIGTYTKEPYNKYYQKYVMGNWNIENKIKGENKMEKIEHITNTSFEVALLVPGANEDNTTITIDTKERQMFVTVNVDAKALPEYINEQCVLGGEKTITIPNHCDVNPVVEIEDGIIFITHEKADHIKEIKIG